MEISEFILRRRALPGEGGLTPEQVMARSGAAEEPALSLEEQAEAHAVALLTRGYTPGSISMLSVEIGEAEAALAGEREKIARAERKSAHLMRMHAEGRISAWELNAAAGDDDGDPERVQRLQERLASLRGQLARAHETAARPRDARDYGPDAAARSAHEEFVQNTRARMAAAEAGYPRQVVDLTTPVPERPPFASRGSGAAGLEPSCPGCIAAGATAEESFLIHSDPQPGGQPGGEVAGGRQGTEAGDASSARAAGESRMTEYPVIVRASDVYGKMMITR